MQKINKYQYKCKGEVHSYLPKNHFARRDTQKDFLKYMLKNPFYFIETFQKEPTKENILEEFRLIKNMNMEKI